MGAKQEKSREYLLHLPKNDILLKKMTYFLFLFGAPSHMKFGPSVKFSISNQVEKNCCHT